MTSTKYDVLGIGNAIFDVLVQTDEALSRQTRHDQGRHGADRRGARAGDLRRHGAGHGNVGRLGRQHHRRHRQFWRPHSLCRKSPRRPDRPSLYPRHPRRRRRLRNNTRGRRPRHRLLLHPGDAGRRAHHEHISRRRAGSEAGRHRRRADRGLRHRLSRRLSLGSRKRQGSVCQSRHHRSRRRPKSRADAVGFLLRRSLPRRIFGPDAPGAPST